MSTMVSVFDVAQYILQQMGPMSAIKLQKLVYYCQAWYLAWNKGNPLFKEQIEAWINGPVVRELYNEHRGQSLVQSLNSGNSENLTIAQKCNIQTILSFYGEKSSSWLILRSHQEKPWQKAREGLGPMQASTNIVLPEIITAFYNHKDISKCVQ